MRKKIVGLAVAAATASLALAGCGSGDADGSSTGADGSTKITWSFWIGGAEDQTLWNDLGNSVTDTYPDISMELRGAPWGDYWTKLPTQLAGSDAPCVFGIQSGALAAFKDSILPLDDLIAKDDVDLSAFDDVALDAMTVDGSVYALPYDTGPMIMFYNKDMFDQAGVTPQVDWTADEFEAAARKIKDATGLPTLGNHPGDNPALSLAHAYAGAFVWAADGSVDLNNPDLIDTWEWQAGLVKEGLASKAVSGDGDVPRTDFIGGSVATFIGGPWDVIDISDKASFDVGVVTIPRGPHGDGTLSSGSGFAISKSCPDPEAAMKAVETLTGPDAQETLASGGRAFVSRTAQQDAWYEKAADVTGVKDALVAAQATAVPFPSSPESSKVGQLMMQYVALAQNGDEPAADVAQQIQSQLG